MKESVIRKLEGLLERYEEVQALMGEPSVISDQERFRNLNKEYSQQEDVVSGFLRFQQVSADLQAVLEMLDGDDAEMRAMAQAHGVHIFDPEGHVLYLADGSEARAPSLAAPEPGAPSQCISGVRFDGVYETKREKGWTYLCFTADGKIFWQSTGGRFQARAAMESFGTGDSFIVKGTYKPGDNAFSARLKASFGAFKMNGVLKEDGLHVHSERTNGSYPFDSVYTFLPL